MDEIDANVRALVEAQKRSAKASEARMALPAGSSRPRVTTANARWMRASEDRDHYAARLRTALERLSEADLSARRRRAAEEIDRTDARRAQSVRTLGAYALRDAIDFEALRRTWTGGRNG